MDLLSCPPAPVPLFNPPSLCTAQPFYHDIAQGFLYTRQNRDQCDGTAPPRHRSGPCCGGHWPLLKSNITNWDIISKQAARHQEVRPALGQSAALHSPLSNEMELLSFLARSLSADVSHTTFGLFQTILWGLESKQCFTWNKHLIEAEGSSVVCGRLSWFEGHGSLPGPCGL